MSSNRSYLLTYHPANFDEAALVKTYLMKAGYSISYLKSNQFTNVGDFAKAIDTTEAPLILLISDNFLKSADCLYGFFEVFKKIRDSRELVVIVCDGKIEVDNDFEQIPTTFKKLSGLIKYLNSWQNQYLDLRTKKRFISEEEREEYEQKLRVTRNISTEVGDFMKSINELGTLDFQELINTNFEAFYQKVNDISSFENYLRLLADEADQELSTEPQEDAFQSIETSSSEETELGYSTRFSDLNDDTPVVTDVEIEDDEEGLIPEIATTGNPLMPEFKSTEEIIENAEEESLELISSSSISTAPAGDLNILFEKDMSNPLKETPVPESVANIMAQANEFFKAGNEADGLKVLKDGIATYPKDTNIRYGYAASLARYTRSYNLAKFHLKANLDIDPEHTKSLFLLGRMAELGGDRTTAINFYKSVADNQSNFPEVNFRLGLLYMVTGTGTKKDIKKYLKKELLLNPQNVEATYRLGTLYAETENKKDKGIETFKKVLQLEPKHKFVNYDFALLHYKHGDYEMARYFYKKATDINPELKTPDNDAAFGIKKEEKIVAIKQASNAQRNGRPKVKKTVLITGATSGIGRATANVFAENGYRLILTGRRLDRLEDLKADFEKENGSQVQILNFDVRDKKSTENAINSLSSEWKKVDILINNAGLAKGFSPIHEGDYSHWETMIDTNLKGLLYMTRTVAPFMVKRKSGHIINLGSIAGKEAYPNGNVYNATKFAVDGLTKAMRIDLVSHNIRVSQICPGHVEETEFAKVRFDGDEERAKIYDDFNPLTSRDVAETIYFIATRPAHVNISDMLITGTQQATATIVDKTGRK